jgi:hypothetical protein
MTVALPDVAPSSPSLWVVLPTPRDAEYVSAAVVRLWASREDPGEMRSARGPDQGVVDLRDLANDDGLYVLDDPDLFPLPVEIRVDGIEPLVLGGDQPYDCTPEDVPVPEGRLGGGSESAPTVAASANVLPQGAGLTVALSVVCPRVGGLARVHAYTAATSAAGQVTGLGLVGADVDELLGVAADFDPDGEGGWRAVPHGYDEAMTRPFVIIPGASLG